MLCEVRRVLQNSKKFAMGENRFLKNTSVDSKKIEDKAKSFTESELVLLFKENKLSKDILIVEARNRKENILDLCYWILNKLDLGEVYLNYTEEIGKQQFENEAEESNIIFSFLEQFQQKPEPAKIEQEPQVVDTPVTPAAPVDEEQQPVATPSQASKVQSVEPTPPIMAAEAIPRPERKDWWEVKRETEVMAIEDLDGRMSKFKKHVKELGVAEEDANGDWQWTGGNKKLVFLGDILGDRNMFGTEIAFNIGGLAEQAEKEGGQVDFLCGNHDMAFINFLCKSWKEIDNDTARRLSDQYIGIWELAKFDPNPNSEFKKIDPFSVDFRNSEEELWQRLYDKVPEILAGMRSDKMDKYFLEDICRIKVAVVYDDILYCHTDPTTAMVPDLTKDGNIAQRVAEVNKIFQENLRKAIFDGEKLSGEFREIEEIYLNTDNRSYFVEDELSVFSGAANILLKNIINKVLDIDKDKLFLWVSWKEQVFKRSSLINLDRAIIIESIEEWERDNNLAGNYIDEIIDILNAFKHNNKKEVNAKEEVLLKKIIRLNQKNDNVEKVRNSGINAIIHGHSPLYDRFYDEKGLIIVSPHGGFSGAGDKGGVSTVRENGRIDLIGKSFRVKKPV